MPGVAWDGWFSKGKCEDSRKLFVQNMILLMIKGKILGQGEDEKGKFVIEGTFDVNGKVEFNKEYEGHEPEFCFGQCTNGKHLSGSWKGSGKLEGNFLLQRELTKEDLLDLSFETVLKVREELRRQGAVTTARVLAEEETIRCFSAECDRMKKANGFVSDQRFLAHGTHLKHVDEIAAHGFSGMFANGGMYGRGEYFVDPSEGPSLKKAQNFAKGVILICMVELGSSKLVGASDAWNTGDTRGRTPIDHTKYDSVVGDKKMGYVLEDEKNTKEYVVYNPAQILPVAAIYYCGSVFLEETVNGVSHVASLTYNDWQSVIEAKLKEFKITAENFETAVAKGISAEECNWTSLILSPQEQEVEGEKMKLEVEFKDGKPFMYVMPEKMWMWREIPSDFVKAIPTKEYFPIKFEIRPLKDPASGEFVGVFGDVSAAGGAHDVHLCWYKPGDAVMVKQNNKWCEAVVKDSTNDQVAVHVQFPDSQMLLMDGLHLLAAGKML